jgi:GDP/UDP-N,N'-diacetylbacillosamine 2-epimerase (hydrolysing)
MRKICIVITARPSYSRVKTLLTALKNSEKIKLDLIIMASALVDRYGTAVDYIEKDGFEISEKLYTLFEGSDIKSAPKTTAIGILELSNVFDRLKPDIVVTIADRYETIATAIAASFMNITLVHIQGGEVTGNIDEKVRHSITKLSDYHMVSSDDAKNRVIKMGENPNNVFVTGCPSIDIAKDIFGLDFNPLEKYGGVGCNINFNNGYLVVMQHPVTTEIDSAKLQILETIKAVENLKIPTFWFWPNVDTGSDLISKEIRTFREKKKLQHVHFFKNMEPKDFLKLLKSSIGIIGNSSVGIRECSFLGTYAINVGSRQNKRLRSNNVIDVDYNYLQIEAAVKKIVNLEKPKSSSIYGDGNAGYRIANILETIELTSNKTIEY